MLSSQYLAGFFDGEGNVGIYRGGGTGRTLRAQLTQAVSPEVDAMLAGLVAQWGGSLTVMNRQLRRQAWNFQLSGSQAYSFLEYIFDGLIFKREQAELAMLWFDTRPSLERCGKTGHHLPRRDADIALTDRVAQCLKDMKRGDPHQFSEIRQMLIQTKKGD